MNENTTQLNFDIHHELNYKVKRISYSAIYVRESESHLSTMALVVDLIEKLPKKRKYLRAYFGDKTLLKANQQLLQKRSL